MYYHNFPTLKYNILEKPVEYRNLSVLTVYSLLYLSIAIATLNNTLLYNFRCLLKKMFPIFVHFAQTIKLKVWNKKMPSALPVSQYIGFSQAKLTLLVGW